MTMRFTSEARHLEERHQTKCLICHRSFCEGDTTHIGYRADGRVICVGDCCSGELVETAIRHMFMPRPYEVPTSKTVLWRYMDFSKFVSLISTETLYFCRIDKLDDPFEGAMGSEELEELWCNHYLKFFRDSVTNPPPGYSCTLSDAEIEASAQRLLKEFRTGNTNKSQATFVNCWYEAEHESDAMWRLYSQQSQYAIAVRTTVGRLRKCAGEHTTIGRMRYIDYSKQFPDIGYPHFFKRKSFEHEREVRSVIIEMESDCVGKNVPVDLQSLIQEIKISPLSPPWFMTVVQDIKEKYGLNVSVTHSSLTKKAFR
jgi:hypothetical protein